MFSKYFGIWNICFNQETIAIYINAKIAAELAILPLSSNIPYLCHLDVNIPLCCPVRNNDQCIIIFNIQTVTNADS